VHHRHQECVRAESADELALFDPTLGVDRNEVHPESASLEILADLVDSRMLDRGGDDVAAFGVRRDRSEDSGVIAFAGAGGEEDLAGAGIAE
jgi:hypothetical protein